jgi:hypothetical protein
MLVSSSAFVDSLTDDEGPDIATIGGILGGAVCMLMICALIIAIIVVAQSTPPRDVDIAAEDPLSDDDDDELLRKEPPTPLPPTSSTPTPNYASISGTGTNQRIYDIANNTTNVVYKI